MRGECHVTGVERHFSRDDLIVSKTDPQGRIAYANRTFLDVSGYTEKECLGQPHNMIRHPDMPRCVFKLMWETIQEGREMFAYVVNRCKNGDHYWVYAHVTPSRDAAGTIVGYHSNRRAPDMDVVRGTIMPLYEKLRAAEQSQPDRKAGLELSGALLAEALRETGLDYDEYVMTLGRRQRRARH